MKSRAPGEADISPYVRQATEGQRAADKKPPAGGFFRARRPDGKLIVPGVRGEQISFIAHRLDAIRLGRAVEQFFPQARNRHIHTAIHTIVTDAAQIFQQRITIHNLSGVGGQFPQQLKISR